MTDQTYLLPEFETIVPKHGSFYSGRCGIRFSLTDHLFHCEGESCGIYGDHCDFKHDDLVEVAKHWYQKHLERSIEFLKNSESRVK